MTGNFWHRAFGLLIHSELELPECAPAEPGQADVTIRFAPLARARREQDAPHMATLEGMHVTENGVLLRANDVGDFLILEGREILITPDPGAETGALRLYAFGSALGILFHQRGQIVLHGAAVAAPPGVAVFVGESGAGKSTLAAGLATSGFAVLCDDTLPLTHKDSRFVAWPGAMSFKMREDSLTGVGQSPEPGTRITSRHEKHFFRNPATAADLPHTIAEVFVLEHGADFRIDPLEPIHAMNALTEHTYRQEIPALMGRQAQQFQQMAALCECISVYRFQRPRDLARMTEAVEVLRTHWRRAA